ncbi:MAG: type II toxin-antitoxin system VapC family toxin [Chloroflexota bacterium]
MIIVDTSALIDSLTGTRRSSGRLRALIADGERLALPSLVLYEWWRGPRTPAELAAQEALFPADEALPFGVEQAALAARLYGAVTRARGREVDLAIAAHAISRGARLWTLNVDDFDDIPGVVLAHRE